MNEQEKQLLIQDLCARLPFGVKICLDNYHIEEFPYIGTYCDKIIKLGIGGSSANLLNNAEYYGVKPYLRPLSSMSEEEREYMEELSQFKCTPDKATAKIDFYLKHHFDFRNLIEKGLAIAVTPDNNPYKLK